MKPKWTNESMVKLISGLIIVAFGVMLYTGLQNAALFRNAIGKFVSLFTPFIFGFVLAFLLNRPMMFFEKKVFGPMFRKVKRVTKIKWPRVFSVVLVFLLYVLVLTLFIWMFVPQLVDSIKTLVGSFNYYVSTLQKLLADLDAKLGIDNSVFESIIGTGSSLITKLLNSIASYLPQVFDVSKQVTSTIINMFIGFICAIYMLLDKERFCAQAKKITYCLFKKSHAERIINVTNLINDKFCGFIIGKIIDSIIIGILCFIGMSIFKLPYALLISAIVGVTNVIPYFGPLIGAIPSAFILLVIEPKKCLIFLIFVFILQQADGYVIGPRILGDTTQLSGFWVMFSILIGGSLFGVVGMFVAVPLFSAIYVIIKEFLTKRLRKKGYPDETTEYMSKGPLSDDALLNKEKNETANEKEEKANG